MKKKTIRLTKDHIDDIKQLLDLMGVSYVQANGEAEAYASEMCRQGMVDYVITEDMDTMAFGCPRMIRTCLDKSIKRKDIISVIDLKSILTNFAMSYEQFIDMCILCGCDYCDTLPKIGSQRAFQNIQKYGSIEQIIDSDNFEVPDSFREKYKPARDLFTMFTEKLERDSLPIVSSPIDYEGLTSYLVDGCGMNPKRVNTSLSKIKRANPQ